jgi:hypothetical protein
VGTCRVIIPVVSGIEMGSALCSVITPGEIVFGFRFSLKPADSGIF